MRSIHCAVRAALWGTPDLNGSFAWAWDEHGPAVVIVLGMDWTTYFAKGRQERSLPGVVLDVESLDGIDIGAERTNRVQITATSDHVLSVEDMPNLVEFLDVAARALGRCAAGPSKWTALVLTVRAESGSIGALLIDEGDALARSGAIVMISLTSLEEQAAERPWADEDPEGFERADRALRERVRSAISRAAGTEPARSSIATLRSQTPIAILVDPVGEVDPADFVPIMVP
ncbi:MAG: hypothetical protein RLZZ116_350 [Planctomycetota bacterium]|jgi:hypothetical protein